MHHIMARITQAWCCLLASLLLLFHPPTPCSALVAAANTNLPAVVVIGAYEPVSYNVLSAVLLAYQVEDYSLQMNSQLVDAEDDMVLSVGTLQTDFAVMTQALTAQQQHTFPTLQQYPLFCAAIVPIARLDALGSSLSHLTLSRETLAMIFVGEITEWDDARIVATNPLLSLPAQSIIVVYQNQTSSINRIFATALSHFLPNFTSYIDPDTYTQPAWPTSSYAQSIGTISASGNTAAVAANDGSISYSPLIIAQEANAQCVSLVNQAGQVVQASQSSVDSAITAVLAEQVDVASLKAPIDCTDAVGGSSWPISYMSWLLVDNVNSRSSCHSRQSMVEYWVFFYSTISLSSTVVLNLLNAESIAPVPAFLDQATAPDDAFIANVQCNSMQLVQNQEILSTRTLSVTPQSLKMATLLSSAYAAVDATVQWMVQEVDDQLAFDQLVSGEVDVAFFAPESINANLYSQALASDEFLILPAFITSFSWIYNPRVAPNLTIPTLGLTMDQRTVQLVFFSCMLYWNDSALVALNPQLAEMGSYSSDPIYQISGCGPGFQQADISWTLSDRATQYTELNPDDTETDNCINDYPYNTQYNSCESLLIVYNEFVPEEQAVATLVAGTIGSMGYIQLDGPTSLGVPIMLNYDVHGAATAVQANLSSIAACLGDTFDPVALQFTNTISSNLNCWPYIIQSVMMVRKNYSAAANAGPASSCTRGLDALQFIRYFLQSSDLDPLFDTTMTVRVSTLTPQLTDAYIALLNQVLCDGETLLITLPIVWSLNGSLTVLAQASAVLGSLYVLVLAGYMLLYRKHPIMRASSPLFNLISLLGILLLFGAVQALSADVSTVSCAAFCWLTNLGAMMMLAPIAAKTYRIWRIFGQKRLRVQKLSNNRLLSYVFALLIMEVIILSCWQAIAPAAPVLRTIVSGSPSREHDYTQCNVQGQSGAGFFALVVVEKSLLLIAASMFAFSTRKVTSDFNESSGIALAVYNSLFTIGIIAPLIALIDAVGDIRFGLFMFMLVWISFFSASILVIPKILLLQASSPSQTQNSVNAVSKKSSEHFTFLDLSEFKDITSLAAYQAALMMHFQSLENKIALMSKATDNPSVIGASKLTSRNALSPLTSPQNRIVVAYASPTYSTTKTANFETVTLRLPPHKEI